MPRLTPEQARNIYRRQAGWFAMERNRLLRKADIASKWRVLDLGAGTGETLSILDQRARGFAVGVDCNVNVLRLADGSRVVARAQQLPFPAASFDLVFTQMFFLWVESVESVIAEISRILMPRGHLIVAAEPDYGGAIEYPASGNYYASYAEDLSREGADIHIARKLSGYLKNAGFQVECGIHPTQPLHAACLETENVQERTPAYEVCEFLFVPYFHFLATRK